MFIKTINSFNKVFLSVKNLLLICDIDDTILTYDKNLNHFYEELKLEYPDQNEDYYLRESYNRYLIYINKNKPFHTDYNGFIDMNNKIKELNGKIIFLTARNKRSEIVTRKHFEDIGLNYNDYEIHYTDNRIPKGDYIKYYLINYVNYVNDIIFIDDMTYNIDSVLKIFPRINCYKFVPNHYSLNLVNQFNQLTLDK